MEGVASKGNKVVSLVVHPDDWEEFKIKTTGLKSNMSAVGRELIRGFNAGRIVLEPGAGPARKRDSKLPV